MAKKVVFRCEMCGGTLKLNDDHATTTCEYCGRISPVTPEMAPYIEKIEAEEEDKKAEEKAIKEEKELKDSQALETFKSSKLNIFIIIAFVLCLISVVVSFSNGNVLKGLIALLQVIIFSVAWLDAMQFIRTKFSRLYILLTIIGCLLVIPFYRIKSSSSNISIDKSSSIPTIEEDSKTNVKEGIYSFPLKSYAGKNLASVGKFNDYEKYRYDEYGNGELKLIYKSDDGGYIDPSNEEQLKEYKVIDQNLPSGASIINVHSRYSDGKPAEYSVAYQNYDQIILYVSKNKTSDKISKTKPISPTLDRHKYHVRNYIGLNAASIGEYNQYEKDREDEYGDGQLKINYSTANGDYIDPSDVSQLRDYVVVSQDIKPDTELELTYSTYSTGKEAEHSVRYQNYDEITLNVKKLSDTVINEYPEVSDYDKSDAEVAKADNQRQSDKSEFSYDVKGGKAIMS